MKTFKVVTSQHEKLEVEAESLSYSSEARIYYLKGEDGSFVACYSAEHVIGIYKKESEKYSFL